jgi:hypothetical protein
MKNQRSLNDAKTDLRLSCLEVVRQHNPGIEVKDAEKVLKFVDQDNALLRLDCVDLAGRSSCGNSTTELILKEAEAYYKFVIAG